MTTTFVARPSRPSAAVGVGSAALAVALIADGSLQRLALVLVTVGLCIAALGGELRHRDRPGVGIVAVATGGTVAIAGIAFALVAAGTITRRVQLAPGLVGLLLLGSGLLPLRRGREYALVSVGAILLFVSVVLTGIVRGVGLGALLAAGVATVLAWDAAEHSITLGQQVGANAESHRADLVHVGGTVVAGIAAVATTLFVFRFNVDGLSLSALLVLLAAAVLLAVALYR